MSGEDGAAVFATKGGLNATLTGVFVWKATDEVSEGGSVGELVAISTGKFAELVVEMDGETVFPIGALDVKLEIGEPAGDSAVLVINGEITGEAVKERFGLDAEGTGARVVPTDGNAGDFGDIEGLG